MLPIVAKFEAASLPTLSDEERQRLLTFVVVGGGPTGVEFSGELFDFLQQDVKRYYPKLTPLVRTKILQSGKGVLETFDKNMQDMALTNLKNSGVEVILNARVTALSETEITFVQVCVCVCVCVCVFTYVYIYIRTVFLSLSVAT